MCAAVVCVSSTGGNIIIFIKFITSFYIFIYLVINDVLFILYKHARTHI